MNNHNRWSENKTAEDIQYDLNFLIGCTNYYSEGSKELELSKNALKFYIRAIKDVRKENHI